MARCQECRRSVTTSSMRGTMTGRRLCRDCYRDHAMYVGAGASMVSGAAVPVGDAVVQGMATRGFAGAVTGEAAASRRRRDKLAATQGFWRRLWVRVVG